MDLEFNEEQEMLGLMRAFEAEELIRKATNDSSKDVRETAEFILKRFSRMRNQGDFKPGNIN